MDDTTAMSIPVEDNLNISTLCTNSAFHLTYLTGPPGIDNEATEDLPWATRSGLSLDLDVSLEDLDAMTGTYVVTWGRGSTEIQFNLHLCKLQPPSNTRTHLYIDLDEN